MSAPNWKPEVDRAIRAHYYGEIQDELLAVVLPVADLVALTDGVGVVEIPDAAAVAACDLVELETGGIDGFARAE